ncbi:MAG: hypothetical protein ACLQUY_09700 [Ktedonobacterales bacterium]
MPYRPTKGGHLYRLKLTPGAHVSLTAARDPELLQEIVNRGKIINETVDVWAHDIKTEGGALTLYGHYWNGRETAPYPVLVVPAGSWEWIYAQSALDGKTTPPYIDPDDF